MIRHCNAAATYTATSAVWVRPSSQFVSVRYGANSMVLYIVKMEVSISIFVQGWWCNVESLFQVAGLIKYWGIYIYIIIIIIIKDAQNIHEIHGQAHKQTRRKKGKNYYHYYLVPIITATKACALETGLL